MIRDAVDQLETSIPASGPQDSALRFVVVHQPCIKVRAQPSSSASVIRYKMWGTELRISRSDAGWLKLADEDGWVLQDGHSLGLGVLLQALPAPGSTHGLPLPPSIVLCTDGLCNRLRVVLSFALIAKRTERPLIVVWPLNSVCEQRFTDGFEPLPGVTFLDKVSESMPRPQFCPPSHDFHPVVKAAREESLCYEALAPNDTVKQRVAANVSALAPCFISMHIRRTDHWGSTCSDVDFESFMDTHSNGHAYLATDNAQTQDRFMRCASYQYEHGTHLLPVHGGGP